MKKDVPRWHSYRMNLLTLNLRAPLSWPDAVPHAPCGPASTSEAAGAAAATAAGPSAPAILAVMTSIDSAPEDSGAVLVWDWDAVVVAGDDGPRCVRPMPAPSAAASLGLAAMQDAGRATGSARAERLADAAASAHAAAQADTVTADGVSLAVGRYSFVQTRKPASLAADRWTAWIEDTVEWFARETWWACAPGHGPLVLRLVREDGETAVQLLRALAG